MRKRFCHRWLFQQPEYSHPANTSYLVIHSFQEQIHPSTAQKPGFRLRGRQATHSQSFCHPQNRTTSNPVFEPVCGHVYSPEHLPSRRFHTRYFPIQRHHDHLRIPFDGLPSGHVTGAEPPLAGDVQHPYHTGASRVDRKNIRSIHHHRSQFGLQAR